MQNPGEVPRHVALFFCVRAEEDIGFLDPQEQWVGLQSVAAVECERRAGKHTSVETRYFISSLKGSASAAQVLRAVREHWSIENGQHWSLDVAFREDVCRVRRDNAGLNLAALRKRLLSLLKQETTTRIGIALKRARAGWDNDFLLNLLAN